MDTLIADDLITPAAAVTLSGLFRLRSQRSANAMAYRHFDSKQQRWSDLSWHEMAVQVARWQVAMQTLGLQPGERVAVMVCNCPEWAIFEQAALGLGLVIVPLYVNDRPGNVAYILNDANVRLLLLENLAQWNELKGETLPPQLHLWSLESCDDSQLHSVAERLPAPGAELVSLEQSSDALATIVYTSGTTGRPKGVMLSHANILWNAHAGIRAVAVYSSDLFLSFLPLSHALERTIGYYLPMMAGATVAFARSVLLLAEDLITIKPTILISVPRIYERTYAKINAQLQSPVKRKLFEWAVASGWGKFQMSQGRGHWQPLMLLYPLLQKLVASKIMAKLGGRVRIAICGGAPMPEHVGRTFLGLGLNLLQGYGMTEFSPVASVNVPANNDPLSVGPPLPEVEVRIGKDNELLLRGPGVMLGYWNNQEVTNSMIDSDGWLHTGDKARVEGKRVYITGRLKDVLVLANGEKVPPADVEMAISTDPLFEQVMLIGDNRPFLTALLVLNREEMIKRNLNSDAHLEEQLIALLCQRLSSFPGYAQIRRVAVVAEPWTVENEMLTPTLKLKRAKLMERHQQEIANMYEGHE